MYQIWRRSKVLLQIQIYEMWDYMGYMKFSHKWLRLSMLLLRRPGKTLEKQIFMLIMLELFSVGTVMLRVVWPAILCWVNSGVARANRSYLIVPLFDEG